MIHWSNDHTQPPDLGFCNTIPSTERNQGPLNKELTPAREEKHKMEYFYVPASNEVPKRMMEICQKDTGTA